MFLSMVIGAGFAVWSAVGIALIMWTIYSYRKDRKCFTVAAEAGILWVGVTAVISWAMLA